MATKDYVLWLDIEVHNLEGVHNGQLLLQLLCLQRGKLTHLPPFLSNILHTVLVNKQVEPKSTPSVGPTF